MRSVNYRIKTDQLRALRRNSFAKPRPVKTVKDTIEMPVFSNSLGYVNHGFAELVQEPPACKRNFDTEPSTACSTYVCRAKIRLDKWRKTHESGDSTLEKRKTAARQLHDLGILSKLLKVAIDKETSESRTEIASRWTDSWGDRDTNALRLNFMNCWGMEMTSTKLTDM